MSKLINRSLFWKYVLLYQTLITFSFYRNEEGSGNNFADIPVFIRADQIQEGKIEKFSQIFYFLGL